MKTLTEQVSDSINRIYDIKSTFEYPGFIAIPERFVNDDTDASDYVWCVGLGDDHREWTGQLMTADGSEQVNNTMEFTVAPDSDDPDTIASAIYSHGIGDLYIGGGCSDPDCPRVRR